MNESVPQNAVNETPTAETPRQPWQPLDFEKIAAADAEVGFVGTGADNAIYS